MNEILKKRKSIRSYTGEKVTEAELASILKAAYAAPVGMGRYDTLHITVVQNPELIGEIDALTATVMEKMTGRPMEHPLYGAPTLIVVSAPKASPKMANVTYSNAAIVVHNMAIEATDLGVGACHIWGAVSAMYTSPDMFEKLHLPEGYAPCCALAVGKSEETYQEREIPENRISTEIL